MSEHNNAPAVPQGEPVDFDSIIEDVEAIDCRYRGDPSYDRDPYYIRERAANVVRRHASYYATLAPAPAQEPVMLTDAWLLEQFKHHPNWELSTSNDPECDPNLFWLVHEVKGGRNDREWFLIGEGATPRHAIIAALRAKGGK